MDLPQPKCSSQIFLAVLILFGFFGVFGWILTHPIPAENHDAVVFVLSLLAAVVGSATGFFFGSSVGSANKDKALADMAGSSAPGTITATLKTEATNPAPQPPAAGVPS